MNSTSVHYFTADTHYGQANLVRGISKWSDKHNCRDFSSLSEMNDTIVDNINATVGEDDVLWHIGDWSMGKRHNVAELRSRIKCKTVYLVLGNHDWMIHRDNNLRALFNAVYKKHSIVIDEHQILLDHFPNLIWDRHHYGSWHLHGHCHGTLNHYSEYYKRKVFDVGIDTHPEFRPYSFDEIEDIMSRRSISKLDHHREK